MNTLKGARQKWTEVFEDPNLNMDSLKNRAISQHNLGVDGIRSVCWKVYLSCLPSLEIATWPLAMAEQRESYVKLRKKYIRAIGSDDGPEPDLEVNNPLSLAEDSPWQQFFVDSELRKIIKQDVDRTLPDNDYFRSEKPNLNNHTQPFERPEAPEPPAGKQTPVIEWSMKIFHYLERVDNELYLHLKNLEIQPQLFGIRWFRLLFSREFPMDDVLSLWDGIFAKDPSLNLCIFIGLALLLRIRDDLLEEDFAGCLHKLMRYPPVKDVQLFIPQALKLQTMSHAAVGQEIIRQNLGLAGKPLPELPSLGADTDQNVQSHQQQPYKRDGSPSPYARQSNQQLQHNNQSGLHYDQPKSQILGFPGNGGFVQLPPAALDAIKPVAEGFVHATKNVLESKGGAAINKAINDMKKNTQSYIRKANASASASPASASPASSFPPMFDQAISSSSRTVSTQPGNHPSKNQTNSSGSINHSFDSQFQMQLGQVVAKALVILETEFTSPANNDESSGIKERIQTTIVKNPSKAAVAAMSGLEHVRDVLLGLAKDLDPLVIESRMLDSSTVTTTDINNRDTVQTNTKLAPSAVKLNSDNQSLGASSTTQRRPINATVATTTKAGSPSSLASSSSVRSSLEAPRDGQTVSRILNYTSGANTFRGSEQEPPIRERYVPTPPPPAPAPKPFSFDDLIEDTAPSSTGSTSPLSDSRVGSSVLASKVKSPRSSLAHSQFSWMLNDEGTVASTGLTGSTSGTGGSLSSTQSSLSKSSSPSPSHRVKVDPLAGSPSKHSGSLMSEAGSGLTSISNQQLQKEDPLRL
ncbi:TBC1 domain, member 5 [Entomortierella lignicola]|nr:TBC1 domain, member 5 [Entomortierella lignicola]